MTNIWKFSFQNLNFYVLLAFVVLGFCVVAILRLLILFSFFSLLCGCFYFVVLSLLFLELIQVILNVFKFSFKISKFLFSCSWNSIYFNLHCLP